MSNKYLPFASVVVVKSSAVFPGVPGSNLTVVPSNPDSPTSFTPSPSVSYQTVSPIEPKALYPKSWSKLSSPAPKVNELVLNVPTPSASKVGLKSVCDIPDGNPEVVVLKKVLTV